MNWSDLNITQKREFEKFFNNLLTLGARVETGEPMYIDGKTMNLIDNESLIYHWLNIVRTTKLERILKCN